MRTYRGVVCEKKNKYMVFLTEKGEFLCGIPIGNPPEVGEEAEFRLAAPSLMKIGKARPRFYGAILIAAAILLFFVTSISPLNDKVMAYVQLDAGEAMEFGVNQKGNVISLRYLNETTEERNHLSGWKNRKILAVLDMAVMELSMHDESIIITTIYPTDSRQEKSHLIITNAVEKVKSKHDGLEWEIAESTPEVRAVANKQKMSVHQFKTNETVEPADPSLEKQREKPTVKPSNKPGNEQKPSKETVPAEPSTKDHQSNKEINQEELPEKNGKADKTVNTPQQHANPHAEQSGKRAEEVPNERSKHPADQNGRPEKPSVTNKNKNINGEHGHSSKSQKDHPANEKKPDFINDKKNNE